MPVLNFEQATLVTNADLEDVTPSGLREFKNMRPVNGILAKTFGMGEKIPDTNNVLLGISGSKENLYTYIEQNLPEAGKMYFLNIPLAATANKLYIYDATGDIWVYLNPAGSDITTNSVVFNLPASTVLVGDQDRNPMFQLANVLRTYPGNIALSTAEGIWLAYIDRDFYDGLHLPAAYTAKFYGYPLNIDPPAVTITSTQLQGGTFSPDTDTLTTKFYKFSYIYDGVQESLLTEAQGITYSNVRFTPESGH